MNLTPSELDRSQRYRLMIGSIIPRPIAFVSTISSQGQLNLAPFSFFSGVGSNPMSLLFCPGNKADGTEKDTLRNCKPVDEGGTGEFVVNLAVESYIREVSAAAEPLKHGESEFDLTGLGSASSSIVRPPRVAASPLAYECRTRQVLRLAEGSPGGANIVIGNIVSIHIDDDLLNDRLDVDPDRLQAIGRMGGITYCRTADRFEVPRGRAALDTDS
jgi:flavin reductase (DIM6/NTAB) family NADH-FMN oxidoreductase RutF